MKIKKMCANCKSFSTVTLLCYNDYANPIAKNVEDSCSDWKPMQDAKCGKSRFEEDTESVLEGIKSVLFEKNRRYGNSALEPINVFSKQDATNSICTRLDDKIGRIKNSTELRKNDVFDLIGYLVLLCISKNWTSFKELID